MLIIDAIRPARIFDQAVSKGSRPRGLLLVMLVAGLVRLSAHDDFRIIGTLTKHQEQKIEVNQRFRSPRRLVFCGVSAEFEARSTRFTVRLRAGRQ